MPHAHVFLQFRGMACLETVSLPAEFGTKVFVFSVQLLLVLLHLSLEAGLHLKCRQGRETSATGTHTHTHLNNILTVTNGSAAPSPLQSRFPYDELTV